MLTDLLMPAQLAYFTTMLYNPNNVCWEASPVTTKFEIEAGKQIAQMLGFDDKAYGHITSGGTLANIEAVWVARNVKAIPFAIQKVAPKLVQGLSDFQLNNLPLSDTLNLVEKIPEKLEELKANSIRGKGVRGGNWSLGKIFVPRTKHYSWNKAADVLGIGTENLVYVDVDQHFRLDVGDLRKKVFQSAEKKEAILMVVGVLGSTEEGSVDPLNEILKLRAEVFKAHGVWFWTHVDAAYGGYSAAIFRDEKFDLIPRDQLIERLHQDKIIDKQYAWPSKETYDAYAAIGGFNSVTIDPHKLGYVPYQAGGIVICDKRTQNLVSYFATYIFQVLDDPSEVPLGSFILEGSKAGAAAAAVWMAHRAVPGNIGGYGKIIGESFEGAQILYQHLTKASKLEVTVDKKTRTFSIHPLNKPDTNLLIYVVNEKGNNNLLRMNHINNKIRDVTSPKVKKQTLAFELMLSSTSLTEEEYGHCPKPLLKSIGIDEKDWDQVKSLSVLRSSLLSPYVTPDYTDARYDVMVVSGIEAVLQLLIQTNQI